MEEWRAHRARLAGARLGIAVAAALLFLGTCATESPRDRARRLDAEGRRLLDQQTAESKQAAVRAYRGALAAWAEVGDLKAQAESAGMIGEVYDNLGDMPEAAAWSERALDLYRKAGDRHGEAMAQSWVGIAEVHLGKVDAGLARFRAGLAIARAAGDREAEAYSLLNIGFGSQRSEHPGATAEGLAAMEQALPVYEVLGDHANRSVVHNNLGRAHFLLGDAARARAHHEQALAIRLEHDLKLHVPWSYANLADTYLDLLDDPAKALALGRQAVAAARASGNTLVEPYGHVSIGDAELALGNTEAALAAYRLARDGSREGGQDRIGKIDVRIGEAELALGRLDDAARTFTAALATKEVRETPTWTARARLGLARIARARGDRDGAVTLVAAAVAELEAARASLIRDEHRTTFVAAMRGTFDLYVELLHERGDTAAAFQAGERGRARSLFETLARAGGPSVAAAPSLGLAEAQALLDDDTALVVFHLGAERSLAWAVTPTAVTVGELPPRAAVEQQARALHELLTARARVVGGERAGERRARIARADADAEAGAQALSRALLGPIAAALDTPRIVVVADGALHYVPLAALPHPRTGKLLVHQELVQIPSIAVLAELRRRAGQVAHPADGRVVVLADPVFAADDARVAGAGAAAPAPAPAGPADPAWVRLRATRDEALAIGDVVPAERRTLALDFAASRETLFGAEVAAASVVHVAAHGVIDAARPERSGLVVSMVDAAGAPRPGRIGLAELAALRLGADLVVLSACRTALGKEVRGEGLLSVTRSFLVAGARRVVATLWTVDDAATAELMRRFYRHLVTGRQPPAAALRAARLELAADPRWRAPYYWAGVTLHGEWR